MFTYEANLPALWNQNDATYAARTAGIRPDGVNVSDNVVTLICRDEQPAANVTAWQAAMAGPPPATPARTAEDIDTALATAMTRLQQILDQPALPTGTLTAAQLSDAARTQQQATKALALALRRTIRLVRADYDGTT